MTIMQAKVIAMDKAAKKWLRTIFLVANTITGTFGIMILLYWLWMFILCLRDYRKYLFSSWFVWACFGVGLLFCLAAYVGYVAATTRSGLFLSCYITSMFLLLLMESLVAAEILLHKKWAKRFPKDPADRFDDFVDYVENHPFFIKFLSWSLLFSQVISLVLAVAVRIMSIKYRSYWDKHQVLPILNQYHIIPPCIFGRPHHPLSNNIDSVLVDATNKIDQLHKDSIDIPSVEKEASSKLVNGS